MIDFWLRIENPFGQKKPLSILGEPKDYFCYDWRLTKNKALCTQLSKFSESPILQLDVDTTWWGQDHAGLGFSIDIFGFYFEIKLYDIRHWNYQENRWEIYPGEDD